MAEEVDVSRALNAISATLNDQRPDSFDAARVQEIATGALGGERKLVAYGSGSSGELREGGVDGPPVATLALEDGVWKVERVPQSRESEELKQFEQQRSQTKRTEYQKPIRGRLAIWKKKLSGG